MQFRRPPAAADLGAPLTPKEYAAILDEGIDQPPWRRNADVEADYVEGNQLSTELMQRLKALGVPPAKENIIGPAIAALCGYEAKTRTDWRVTPDGDPGAQDLADALNYRLNQAERHSKADEAMSEAFRPQASVGLGWVEVTKNSDPFGFPFRCRYVHRNEIRWDMRARERDLSDAAWLVRERYVKKARALAQFPDAAVLIEQYTVANGLGGYGPVMEGGDGTGLIAGLNMDRAWSTREQAWYRRESDEVCVGEVWYRRWVPALILRVKANNRVVEFDERNPAHVMAVEQGWGLLGRATVARVRRSYWIGPVCVHDGPTPHPHPHFQYVPFWGYREDMTGVPFGLVRDMIFPQDNLNSTMAKLRWGMAATRVERTKGAVAMTDEQLRRQVARPDADIVLEAEAMARPGARFEVKRDFQLNAQQFQLMQDSRLALERVSSITASFKGQAGTANSGLQEQTQVEQSQVGIAGLMDNFKRGRAMVGEMLLAMLIADMGDDPQTVVIEGDTLKPTRTVMLNVREKDPVTGHVYLSNDVQRARLLVALEDVPTTSSFRAQQLAALTEVAKSAPPSLQQVIVPFMVDLMDLPRKREVVEAVTRALQQGQADPNAIREQVKTELMHDLKERELANKERLTDAQIRQLMAQAVQTGVQAAFAAMQSGAQVAQMPLIAPIADAIMKGAGYRHPAPAGESPDFPLPLQIGKPDSTISPVFPDDRISRNTSPTFPAKAYQGGQGGTGAETARTEDNFE